MKTNLQESLQRLYRKHNLGIKLGLDVEEYFLQCLGNPEKKFYSIHVAGTNGKGSICAMLASILKASGKKTGLYTSPHLVKFNERIRVNNRAISNTQLARLITECEKISSIVSQKCGREATFFEFTTALAFQFFAEKKVEFAVLETGMGGRLDATNVVVPVVSVISSISMDHEQYLGNTIEKIAAEKAGIIKTNVPVVCSPNSKQVMDVITEIARDRRAPLIKADDAVSLNLLSSSLEGQKFKAEICDGTSLTIFLPLLGHYQAENIMTVLATVYVLRNNNIINISTKHIKTGLSNVSWHGRFQVVSKKPPIILDGAHNPGAGKVLAETLIKFFPHQPVGLIFGMCSDKDMAGFIKNFQSIVKKCWAVPIRTERSVHPSVIKNIVASETGWDVSESSVHQALVDACQWAENNSGVICVAGSLFLVGEVLEIMRIKV